MENGHRHGGFSFPALGRIHLDPDPNGLSAGIPGSGSEVEADVPPTNGGTDRGDLSNATIDDTSTGTVANTTGAAVVPADPNQAAGVTQPQWQSIREAAQAQGFQFDGSVTDDRTALAFLLRQAGQNRQADIHAQLGRQLAPHAQGIQQYLQTRNTLAAPTRQPWEAPEYDQRWRSLVEYDAASGIFYGKPGVDPAIVQKVNEYADWKTKFDQNPGALINQAAEARAKQISADTFREQFAAYHREQSIQQIVATNSQWLYQSDASGQRARDYMGNFIPTPVGARYIHHLQSVQRAGVVDPRQQDELAKNLVRGEYALAAQQQAAAAAAQAANPQTSAAVTQPNVNPLQAQSPQQRRRNPAATEPAAEGLSLMEQLRRDLAAEGVSDQDIHQSAGG